ncbi:flavin reductase [Acidocella sp.]|uniref:flavin reductase n=1 Tax=Acidocella sp. TaxID=50710 RepID=UPI00261204BB|nr:flavin reductase [Acidocella sp.]
MSDPLAAERARFRESMARLGAAVTIVTTSTPEGDVGMTVSAVTSVTDEPPTLLVCINRASRQYEAFRQSGVFCVNVLSHNDEALSPVFAGRDNLPMSARFAQARWLRLATGAPALESATAALDCKVTQTLDVGTHTVFFGQVQAIHLHAQSSGLVYHGRAYHRLAPAAG